MHPLTHRCTAIRRTGAPPNVTSSKIEAISASSSHALTSASRTEDSSTTCSSRTANPKPRSDWSCESLQPPCSATAARPQHECESISFSSIRYIAITIVPCAVLLCMLCCCPLSAVRCPLCTRALPPLLALTSPTIMFVSFLSFPTGMECGFCSCL